MSKSGIDEMLEQTMQLQALAEQFYELMTLEAGKVWKGDAYKACCRESQDNREQAMMVINECHKLIDMTHGDHEEPCGLPEDFLI